MAEGVLPVVDIQGCLLSRLAMERLRSDPKNLIRVMPTKGVIMKIYLNQNEFEVVADTITVTELLQLNQLPATGIAVSVNNKVIRKANWSATALADGDRVTVITAVCGG